MIIRYVADENKRQAMIKLLTSPFDAERLVFFFALIGLCERRNGGFFVITDAKSFGEALRKRRKELGYTQAFLSEFSGFSVSFISDLENGKSTAELGKAIFLANLLGLDCSLTPRS